VSAREQAQRALVDHLTEHDDFWTAPYGVLDGLQTLPKGGKVRTVTFGVARYLDAIAYVWQPDRISVEGRGGMAHAVDGTYASVEEFIEHISHLYY
jgi:hypothetical protein